jgi:hypothetical protein
MRINDELFDEGYRYTEYPGVWYDPAAKVCCVLSGDRETVIEVYGKDMFEVAKKVAKLMESND